MRIRIVAKVLSLIGGVVSLCMLWPMGWAYMDKTPDLRPLGISLLSGLGISLMLYIWGRRAKASDLGIKEAFGVVAFSWILASVIGGLPFWFHGTVSTFTEGFFEAMSGFTTTGASVLTDIEANPRGILFWRSLTHWLGGMGIIVLSLAILPFLGVGGMQLYKAEVPGPIPEKLTPRVQQTALLLWGVYMLLSLLETVILRLCGLDLFESLTHTFGTMATGGFSPLNGSVGQYGSAVVDWVITFFMFLAGANFALHYMVLRGKPKALLGDPEFRFYSLLILGATVMVTFFVLEGGNYDSLLTGLRYAAFQVVSIITTTGFVTADYELWPFVTHLILLWLMFVGGCAGSTGGGMKNVRVMVVLRQAKAEMMRLLHPRGVFPVRIGGKSLENGVVASITAFFILYMGLFILGTLVMAGFGLDVLTAVGSVAATLGNIGPGLGGVGPVQNYAAIPQGGKWVLCGFMLLGRLEIYTILLLLLPATWRR